MLPSGRSVSSAGVLPPGVSLRELSVLDQQAVQALRAQAADSQFLAWMQLTGLAADDADARRIAGMNGGSRRNHGQRGLLSMPSSKDMMSSSTMGRTSIITSGSDAGGEAARWTGGDLADGERAVSEGVGGAIVITSGYEEEEHDAEAGGHSSQGTTNAAGGRVSRGRRLRLADS